LNLKIGAATRETISRIMNPASSHMSFNTVHPRQNDSNDVALGSSRLGSYYPHQSSVEFHSNPALQQIPGKAYSQQYNPSVKNGRLSSMPSGPIQLNSYNSQSMVFDPLLRLEDSFRQAMDELLNDPLMDCFKNSRESQNFMLDRAEEIVLVAVKNSAVQLVNDLHIQLDICQQELKAMSEASKMTAVPSSKSIMFATTITKNPSEAVLIQGAEGNQSTSPSLQEEFESLKAQLADEKKEKESHQIELSACKKQLQELTKELQVLQLDERQKVYKQTLEEKDELTKQLKSLTEKTSQQDVKIQQLKKENGNDNI
jgi:hypothetical protein